MKNYNPMSLFDNTQPMFNTFRAKQEEYLRAVSKADALQKQLDIEWEREISNG